MADRIAFIEQGRLQQIATPQDLYDRPVSRSVAAFVGRSNLWGGVVVDRSTVRTELGMLRCDTSAYNSATPVTVLVRPESIMPLLSCSQTNDRANVFGED